MKHNWTKRVVWWTAVVGVLVVAAGTALSYGKAPLERWIRAGVVESIAADVTIEELGLTFVPPRVTMRGVSVRRGGDSMLEIDVFTVDLLLVESLWEGQWVADLIVERPRIEVRPDAAAWTHVLENREETLQYRRVELRSVAARVALGDARISVDGGFFEVERSGLFEPQLHFSGSGAVAVTHGARELAFRRVSVAGEGAAGRVRIENGLLYGPAGLIRWDGSFDEGAVRLDGSWDTDGAGLASVAPELQGLLAGPSQLRFRLGGTLSEPTARLWWTTSGMEVRGIPVSGTARATIEEGTWRLHAQDLTVAGGRITVDGEGDAGLPWSFRLAGRFQDYPLDEAARLLDVPSLAGRADGEIHLSGVATGSPIDGRARVTLRHGPDVRVTGEGRFERRGGTMRLEADLSDRFANDLAVDLTFENDTIDGRGRLEAARLAALSPFVPGLELEGQGTLEAGLTGNLARVRARGRGEFRDVVVGEIQVGNVTVGFDAAPDGIEVARLEIPAWGATGQGRIAFGEGEGNDWHIETRDLPLERVRDLAKHWGRTLPPVDGRLQATLDVEGRWSDPAVVGEFRIADLGVLGRRFGVAAGILRHVPERGWTVRADVHHPVDGSALVHGRLEPDGTFSAKARATAWRVAEMVPADPPWEDLDGRLQLDASLAGRWPTVNGEVLLETSSLELRGRELEPVRFTAAFGGDEVRVEGRMGERLQLSGNVSLVARNAFRGSASWEDLHLGDWIAPGAELVVRTSGSGELSGDRTSPFERGSFQVRELEVGSRRMRLTNPEAIPLRVRDGVVEIERTRLTTGTDSLSVSGHVGRGDSRLRLDGDTDLGLLETIVPGLGSIRGSVVADLELTQSGEGPWRPLGRVRVEEGLLDVGYSVGVTDVTGEAHFDGSGMDLEELSGRLGGGSIRLEGRIDREAFGISWNLTEANLGVPLWLDYQLSGSGRLEGPWSAPVLSGDVRVVQAVYDRRFEWTEFLPWVRGQIRATPRRAEMPVRLDLRVTADGGVYVENNLVRAELRGVFDVRGFATNPVWSGELQVIDGTFLFRDREFNITTGEVRFRKDRPRNPSLQFLGETVVITEEADYDVQLRVGGTVEEPQVRLTSEDPTLSENDVLALVTFGRTVAQIQSRGTGAGIALEDVLTLTTGSYGRRVERGVYRLLPVDRIEIEPAFTASTGTVEPRFSIGKELMENFRAVLRTGLGTEREQDVALEYQLTRRISLQGQWESRTERTAGTFGGDVRLRFSFWRRPRLSMFRDLFVGDGR